MGFFKKDEPDKDKKKVDFSNVRSGGSSAPAPAPGKRADFSNVESGASSTAPVAEKAASQTYVVKSGDSLSKIAKRAYGDANKWRRIYEANRDVIGPNPDLIHPGQKLVLPEE